MKRKEIDIILNNILNFMVEEKDISKVKKKFYSNLYNIKLSNINSNKYTINKKKIKGIIRSTYFLSTTNRYKYISTNKVIGNRDFKFYIDINTSQNKEYPTLYKRTIYHELVHAITQCLEDNSIISYNNNIYYNTGGKISDTNNNIYGKLLNENLTDMISIIPILKEKDKNINLNDIFKNNKLFFVDKYSIYRSLESLTKLALIAFSNDPKCDYNTKENIFNSKYTFRNGQTAYTNDLLHYHLYNSYQLMIIYNSIVKETGDFNSTFKEHDEILEDAIKHNYHNSIKIANTIINLEHFLKNKINTYLKEGKYNEEDAFKLEKEFITLKRKIMTPYINDLNSNNPSQEVELMGLNRNKYHGTYIQYVDKLLLTKEDYIFSVVKDARSINEVPSNILTEDFFIEIVKQDPTLIKIVPTKYRTNKIYKLARKKKVKSPLLKEHKKITKTT